MSRVIKKCNKEAILEQTNILSYLGNCSFNLKEEVFERAGEYMDALRNEFDLSECTMSMIVKNLSVTDWKTGKTYKDFYTKCFINEINNAKATYGISKTEVAFLRELSDYIAPMNNLVVDEMGIPANISTICKLLDMNRSTVYRNIESLEKCKCLIKFTIENKKDTFVVINPYLFFKGNKIHKFIYDMFDAIGYKRL